MGQGTGKFVKLHPNIERCTRLDMARVLVECNVCKAWRRKGTNCKSKNISVLQKKQGKEVQKEVSDVIINGDGTLRYELNTNRNIVNEFLQELESFHVVAGDISNKGF